VENFYRGDAKTQRNVCVLEFETWYLGFGIWNLVLGIWYFLPALIKKKKPSYKPGFSNI
jgi:hypothetical protein